MKRGIQVMVGTLVAAGALLAAPGGAAAATETATLGGVTAQMTYEKAGIGFKDVRIKVIRDGVTLIDQPAPTEGGCPECPSYPGGAGRSPAVFVLQLDETPEPEVVFDFFTGGLHCCWFSLVLEFKNGTYSGPSHFWGDFKYSFFDPEKDGRSEFKSGDPRFAYAFGAFAATRFPPQVWRFGNGAMIDITRQYPAIVRADVKRLRRQLRKQGKLGIKPLLAALTADFCLLNRCGRGFAIIRSRAELIERAGRFVRNLRRFLRATGYLAPTNTIRSGARGDPGSRIIGGAPANPAEWAFTVAVLSRGRFLCSGSVISPTHVLTAAHCAGQPELAVIAGRSRIGEGGGELIGVSNAATHPNYPADRKYDMAILTLAAPTTVPPIKVATAEEDAAFVQAGGIFSIAGFGRQNPLGFGRPRVGVLRAVRVAVTRPRLCRRIFRGRFAAGPMICTQGRQIGRSIVGRGACSGDSGGPLAARLPDGQPRLFGVASFVIRVRGPLGFVTCGLLGTSVYARVAAGLDFINSVVPPPAPAA